MKNYKKAPAATGASDFKLPKVKVSEREVRKSLERYKKNKTTSENRQD